MKDTLRRTWPTFLLIFSLLIFFYSLRRRIGPHGHAFLKTYEWWPTESAPRGYPVFLIQGRLTLADGAILSIPDQREVANGWGRLGSSHDVGEARKPLPVALDLAWYSLTEDRFFKGRFDLPVDRLSALFDRGVPSVDGKARWSYDRLIFGMAPGGDVSVWASAMSVVREVATFRAPIVDLPWSAVLKDPLYPKAKYLKETLEALVPPELLPAVRARPVPAGRWALFSQRFAWTPQMRGECRGQQIWVRGLNGEVEWIDASGTRKDLDPPPLTRAAPGEIDLFWLTPDGRRRKAVIVFDEDEIRTALSDGKYATTETPVLVFELSGDRPGIHVFLEQGKHIFRFKQTQTNIYRVQ